MTRARKLDDRHEDDVVLVDAERRLALGREDAEHPERVPADADDPPDGVLVAEERVRHGHADEDDLRLDGLVVRVPRGALLHRPVSHHQVRERGAYRLRVAVLVAVDDLHRGPQRGRDRRDARRLAQDGAPVFLGDAHAAALGAARARRLHRLGKDDDEVRADRLDLRRHVLARARAQRRHRHHGGHADEDAEHRERGPHRVAHDRPDGQAYAVEERAHLTPPAARSSDRAWPRARPAGSRRPCRSGCSSSPRARAPPGSAPCASAGGVRRRW